MDTKQKLIATLKKNIEADEVSRFLNYIKEKDYSKMIDIAIRQLYLYSRDHVEDERYRLHKLSLNPNYQHISHPDNHLLLGPLALKIGEKIIREFGLKFKTSFATRIGTFVLYTFEEVGVTKLKYTNGESNATYALQVLGIDPNDRHNDPIKALNKDIAKDTVGLPPSPTPFAEWTNGIHENGAVMVRTPNPATNKALTPETHPLVFECLNRAQKIGWKVNWQVLDLVEWCFKSEQSAFDDVWEMENRQAQASKKRELNDIINIANSFLVRDKKTKKVTAQTTFYHQYYYDFRGRKYPASKYLHEQGCDAARGSIYREDFKPVGEEGFKWLKISIASNWAGDAGRADKAKTDKIPLLDRVKWVDDNSELIRSYAKNPRVNTGWMNADSPFQFIAAVLEYERIMNMLNSPFLTLDNIASNMEVYIDGSNNGCQHLSALTKDEITAEHVNLFKQELPGDLYKYIADYVWADINKQIDAMPDTRKQELDNIVDTVMGLKNQVAKAEPKSEKRKELIGELMKYKNSNKQDIKDASLVFWSRITDAKHRRKVVKRNVMTLPYGGTAYGLGEQQIKDARKHGIAELMNLEHVWGAWLGRHVFEVCKAAMEKPMRLLGIFEAVGKAHDEKSEFVKWNVPVTNFPVTQYYVHGKVKEIDRIKYGEIGVIRSLSLAHNEIPIFSKGKQAQGLSPNMIHSFDAAHLTMLSCRADFPVTTIHDSFGCLLSDMPKLFQLTRETFVEFYNEDPLTKVMGEINGDISILQMGTLDVKEILQSEYAFC